MRARGPPGSALMDADADHFGKRMDRFAAADEALDRLREAADAAVEGRGDGIRKREDEDSTRHREGGPEEALVRRERHEAAGRDEQAAHQPDEPWPVLQHEPAGGLLDDSHRSSSEIAIESSAPPVSSRRNSSPAGCFANVMNCRDSISVVSIAFVAP